MKTSSGMKSVLLAVVGAVALVLPTASAQGQAPVISSFGSNGELVCTNLQPGSTASVRIASSVFGPWTNSPPGLDAVTADTNGAIRVSVPLRSVSGPMFYRIRGVPAPTTPPDPAGMVLIPAGPFVMGDTFAEGYANELPTHTNQISAFYMDQHEVTKALWDTVYQWAMTHGYSFDNDAQGKAANQPAHSMNWYDAAKWCNARSEREGRTPAYYADAARIIVYRTGQASLQNDWVKWNTGYRLPTEAEWEKAARGGTTGARFPWAHTNVITHSQANYNSSTTYAYDVSPTRGYHPTFATGTVPYTSPVGYFASNGYGLNDMAGNVFEWCWDWFGSYSASPASNPRGPVSGSGRVTRGGSWNARSNGCRVANRNNYVLPEIMGNHIGLRTVLPLDQP